MVVDNEACERTVAATRIKKTRSASTASIAAASRALSTPDAMRSIGKGRVRPNLQCKVPELRRGYLQASNARPG